MSTRLDEAIGDVMRMLTEGCFDEVATLTDGRRLSAAEMRCEIDEYGATFNLPPSGFSPIAKLRVKAPTETWRVDVPFWTEEEGQSDLVASWTIRIVDGAAAAIDLDSIRVM